MLGTPIPWELTSSYQAFENEDDINSNLFIVQKPDENTNMFADYRTSLFAISLLLTGITNFFESHLIINLTKSFFLIYYLKGDTSAFSNWTFKENPTLVLLMTFFTFLTVIYLMNVFIGLFTEVIQDDDLEASQLILKAEV